MTGGSALIRWLLSALGPATVWSADASGRAGLTNSLPVRIGPTATVQAMRPGPPVAGACPLRITKGEVTAIKVAPRLVPRGDRAGAGMAPGSSIVFFEALNRAHGSVTMQTTRQSGDSAEPTGHRGPRDVMPVEIPPGNGIDAARVAFRRPTAHLPTRTKARVIEDWHLHASGQAGPACPRLGTVARVLATPLLQVNPAVGGLGPGLAAAGAATAPDLQAGVQWTRRRVAGVRVNRRVTP